MYELDKEKVGKFIAEHGCFYADADSGFVWSDSNRDFAGPANDAR